MIDLYKFMDGKTIKHSDTATNYYEGLQFLANNEDVDGITYDTVQRFSINNIAVFPLDDDGNYVYKFPINKEADIIDNIKVTSPTASVKFEYYIGGKIFAPTRVSKLILYTAVYHEFKLVITFLTKPNTDDTFEVSMRNYLLEPTHRKTLINYPKGIKCDSICYHNGIAFENPTTQT